jgi:flagellar protein FliO/FliZ
MMQGWVSIALLVVLLALLPVGLKWVQRRVAGTSEPHFATTKIVSAIAVGPHQRVVTVETGPQEARVWLTLGVTAQQVNCLHTAVAPNSSPAAQMLPDDSTTSVKP